MAVWTLLNVLLFFGLGSVVLYIVGFAVAARVLSLPEMPDEPDSWPRFIVYIPAYKEDAVIVDTARRAAAHEYPGTADIVVIADSLRADTMEALEALPVSIVRVETDESSKPKALNWAFDETPSGAYDAAVILDADNVMAPGFLEHIARWLETGACAVQGRRIAKNHETALARLDGLSEAINNQVFRRGHWALGLSSALIGSGMAGALPQFREEIASTESQWGVDKSIELGLLRRGETIAYAPEAVTYDEKSSTEAAFLDQRQRWIGAQARYLRHFLGDGIRSALRGESLDYLDKGAQLLLPPRALLLGSLLLLLGINAVFGAQGWGIAWGMLVGILGLGFALAIPPDRDDLSLCSVLYAVPQGVWLGLRAFLQSWGGFAPNTRTPHHTTGTPEQAP